MRAILRGDHHTRFCTLNRILSRVSFFSPLVSDVLISDPIFVVLEGGSLIFGDPNFGLSRGLDVKNRKTRDNLTSKNLKMTQNLKKSQNLMILVCQGHILLFQPSHLLHGDKLGQMLRCLLRRYLLQ